MQSQVVTPEKKKDAFIKFLGEWLLGHIVEEVEKGVLTPTDIKQKTTASTVAFSNS